MKVRIKESELKRLIKESVDRVMEQYENDESYLDFNNNIYNDPSVAAAYVQGGDDAVKDIKPTFRQAMKPNMGGNIDYSGVDVDTIVAECVRRILRGIRK